MHPPAYPRSDPRFTLYVGNQAVSSATVQNSAFDNYTTPSNAGTIYANITGSRNWQWSDFDNLKLGLDQASFDFRYPIYYDAIGLRITTTTGADNSGVRSASNDANALIDASKLGNAFNKAVRIGTHVWSGAATGRPLQGQNVMIAVLDSGVVKRQPPLRAS